MPLKGYFFTLLILAFLPLSAQDSPSSILRIGTYSTTPPYLFAGNSGRITGIEQDLLTLLREKTGKEIVLVQKERQELYNDLSRGAVDGILANIPWADDSEDYLYTSTVFTTPQAVFSLENNLYQLGLNQIKSSRIGISEDSLPSRKYVDRITTSYISYKDTQTGLGYLMDGEIDFLIDDIFLTKYQADRMGYPVNIKGIIDNDLTRYTLIIDKKNQFLKNEIDYAVSRIRKEDLFNLRNKWIGFYTGKKFETLELTDQELIWITENPEIRYSATDGMSPLLSFEGREAKGIIADIMDILSDLTTLEFHPVENPNWSESIMENDFGNGTILPGVTLESGIFGEFHFTETYLTIPNVIVSKKNNSFYINSPEELSNSTLIMVRGTSVSHFIYNRYPELDYLVAGTVKEALRLLNQNKGDYYIGDMITTSYHIRKSGYNQIRIVGKVDFDTEYRIAVPDEISTLVPILNKALSLITPTEISGIVHEWTTLKPEETINYTLLIQIFIVFITIIAIILIWNRKLKLEIQERERSEEALRYSEHKSREAEEISRLARERAEKLAVMAESASKAKSQFLANMSHEIRTPLNSIIGFTELLDSTDLDIQQKQYLNSVKTSAEVLLVLINDVLDISKIEAGKMQVKTAPVKIAKIFHDMEVIFKQKAREKGLNLRFLENEMNHIEFLLDSLRLEQILINLIGNSIKFTETGFISVSAKYRQNPNTRNFDLTLTVADSGIGIKEEERDKIFNLFEQSENQDTRRFGGTGLGLGISSKLVQLMNGEIHVDSMFGKGSVFSIHLPGVACSGNLGNLLKNTSADPLEATLKREEIRINPAIVRDMPSIIEWKRVRDSGDPDAIKEFCTYLMQRQETKENLPFRNTIEQLIQASDEFDLDRILHLSNKMNSFFSEVINE